MALSVYREPGEHNHFSLLVAGTYALFILSLLVLSRGWAALINVPGSVSSFRELSQDDGLRLGVALLGLYFLVSGVSGAVSSVVQWFYARGLAPYEHPAPVHDLLDIEAIVRALCGAALILWGANVVALIAWARSLGVRKGAA